MRPSVLHVGAVLKWELPTFDPDNPGVLKDADSTPTVAVRKNGASTGDSVTVTKRAAMTGRYDCVYDPASEAEADSFQIAETMVMTGSTTAQKTYHNSFSVTVIATKDDISSFIANSIENQTNNWDSAIPVLQAAVLDKLPTTGRAASQASVDAIISNHLAALTVEPNVVANFPTALIIGDSYTSNTGQIRIEITDGNGDPTTGIGSLLFEDADISFTAFRPNDSALLTGTCTFVDSGSETYVLLTLPSSETSKGKAEFTYEGRLKFDWTISSEQKTYPTTPFKFLANP